MEDLLKFALKAGVAIFAAIKEGSAHAEEEALAALEALIESATPVVGALRTKVEQNKAAALAALEKRFPVPSQP